LLVLANVAYLAHCHAYGIWPPLSGSKSRGRLVKAFLSHSSKDKLFVSAVAKELGDLNCELDEKTFDFTFNVAAIRKALERSQVFVYFLSASSIVSPFVSEEQHAALEARGKGLIKRVIVFAIDGTSYKELPSWMQEINIVQKVSSAKACARHIQSILLELALSQQFLQKHLYLFTP
jgi:hypothetical protein